MRSGSWIKNSNAVTCVLISFRCSFIASVVSVGMMLAAPTPRSERHISQFIDDQQFVAIELALQAEQTLFVPGLDQFMADASGGGEPHR